MAAGQRLGAVGTSGARSAERPHLHFGVRDAGSRHAYHDPLGFLPPAPAARPAAPAPDARARPRAAHARAAASRTGARPRAATERREPPPSRPAARARAAARTGPRRASRSRRARAPPTPPRLGHASRRARPGSLRPTPGPAGGRDRTPPAAGRRSAQRAGASRGAPARRAARPTIRGSAHGGHAPARRPAGPDTRLGARLRSGCCSPPPILGLSEDGRKATRRGRDRVSGRAAAAPREAMSGRRPEPLRPARVASTVDVVLRHDAHLLRERRAAPGARLHDDRRRRAGPAHAPARRGRVLPHGHRRARRAGHAGGREARHHPARAGRPQRGPLQGAGRHAQRDQRLLHPHHRPRAHGRGRRGGAAHPRQRPRLRRHLRGLVLPALRRLQDRVRARGRQPCPIHKIVLEIEKEDNWFFRLSTFQEPLERLYAERPDFVVPEEPLQRGALVHQERPARRLAQPRAPEVGRAGARGTSRR